MGIIKRAEVSGWASLTPKLYVYLAMGASVTGAVLCGAKFYGCVS